MPAPFLTDDDRRTIVADFERSGLCLAEFYTKQDIHPSTLNAWCRKFRGPTFQAPARRAFVEVQTFDPPPQPRLLVRIDNRPCTVEVTTGADLDLLRAVVDALC